MKRWFAKLTMTQKMLFANALLMILPQVLLAIFAKDAGMVACFVLWYIVYPLYCLFYGWKMGSDIEYMVRFIPIPALMYLPTVLLLYGIEVAFFLYAGIYFFGICFAAMAHHLLKMYMK